VSGLQLGSYWSQNAPTSCLLLTHSLTHPPAHLLTYLLTCSLTQNVAYKLLGVRCPDFAHRDLTSWWDRGLHASLASTRVGAGGAGGAGGGRAERDGGAVRVLGHYLQRLQLTLQVVDALGLLVELVPRTPPSPFPLLSAPSHTLQPLLTPHQVVDKMELVARTSELARVFGIDFFSVPCYTPLAHSLATPP